MLMEKLVLMYKSLSKFLNFKKYTYSKIYLKVWFGFKVYQNVGNAYAHSFFSSGVVLFYLGHQLTQDCHRSPLTNNGHT